jgi:hypothetical protein
MRRIHFARILAFGLGLITWSHHGAAQQANEQISIVIPSVLKGTTNLRDSDAALISYIVAQSIIRYFLRSPGTHRSSVILIPGPLTDHSPSTIKTLARINGAQIALLMRAFLQKRGVLLDIVMVIPEQYRDFRTDPAEVLNLDFEGSQLRLDIPSRYVAFPGVFLDEDIIKEYKADTYRKLCPIDRCDTDRKPKITGQCRLFGVDVPFWKPLRYYELWGTTAILNMDGVCYQQRRPAEGPISEPIIDFVAGVERYFAADGAVAKKLMAAVVSSSLSKQSNIVLQAYLYLVRISIQANNVDEAKRYMDLALSANKRDLNVLETSRFLNFWLLTRAVQSHAPGAAALTKTIDNDLSGEPTFIRQPYQELLDRLKAKVERGG